MTSEQCVIAEYDSMEAAHVGLEVLGTAAFDDQSVALVTHADDPTMNLKDVARSEYDSPPSGKTAAAGGVIGGSIGGAVGMATMIGPLMIAGPLVGIALGSGFGCALAATDRWGVQQEVSTDYANRVDNGSVLILVNDADAIRLDDAERLLKTTQTRSIRRFR
jgi:hypothetical protein